MYLRRRLSELLVVIAIIAVLAGLLLPALAGAKAGARRVQYLGQMRQVGLALQMHADEHDDEFPRSQHSAFAHRQPTWGRALAPYLGGDDAHWTSLLTGVYHCPEDHRQTGWSYGLNVYFELGSDDDCAGKSQTWRLASSVRRPTETVVFAENASSADHIMPNFWLRSDDAVDVASERHRGGADYTFVDGHAETKAFAEIYEPTAGVDRWHPLGT